MKHDPEFHKEHRLWSSERVRFNAAINAGDELAVEQKWQKHYLKGVSPSGKSRADENNRVKRQLLHPIHAQEQTAPADENSPPVDG